MAIVVVGGSGRGVGKTALVCGLIAALPEFNWTAIKITGHDHGQPKPVWEETQPGQGTDTARFLAAGARFIGTNPDKADPVEDGLEPAAGAILAALEAATGKKPFVVGKPNALMMLIARQKLGSHSSDTVMIGDRMDTDIVAGLEAGMTTCLVLSGVTRREDLEGYAYRPDLIYDHVGFVPVETL